MSVVATFNQVCGSETLRVAIPMTRIDKLIERVDVLIEAGNTYKARKILTPYIVATDKTENVKPAEGKGAKKQAALALIQKLVVLGEDRSKIMEKLRTDLQMTYANARHYVVNVAKV